MHTWVKLHLALDKHDIGRDPTAFRVFMHLLLNADEKGCGIVSRFVSARICGLHSGTFYKALTRCHVKFDLVTLSSNNKYTNYSLKNWKKYQSVGNTSSNNTVTTQEHPYIRARDGVRQEKKGIASHTPKTANTLPVEPCIDGLEQLRESMRMKGLRA